MPGAPKVQRVPIVAMPPGRFATVAGTEQWNEFEDLINRAGDALRGRVIWSVNSTARGGGVAEMLVSLIAYARGAGVDARWLVIEGDSDFFHVTKRLHNRLHGAPGDGGPLGPAEHAMYERTLAANAEELTRLIRPQDIVLLHDPQTAGLVDAVKKRGAITIWRAHIGLDLPNEIARQAWDFLRPYVMNADAFIFSRAAYAWEGLPEDKVMIVPPSIDAFSAKNVGLTPSHVLGVLNSSGLLDHGEYGDPTFSRRDGSPGRVDNRAEVIQAESLSPADRLVTQVSRWDRLKDPIGVMRGFVEHVLPHSAAHLVLAGPAVAAVSDDPEGLEVWHQTCGFFEALPYDVRRQVHLAALPMDDPEENAVIVNALQRHSTVVIQKSLAEGFGLTVAEAMWKGRPVVASRIGGIQDQIEDGASGLLVEPRDLEAMGAAVCRLLDHPELAAGIGTEAERRVRDHFLGPRHLRQYFQLFMALMNGGAIPAGEGSA
jgi:trehalose synthase